METSLNRERNTLTPVTGKFKGRSDLALVLSGPSANQAF